MSSSATTITRRRPRHTDRRTRLARAATPNGVCWATGTVGWVHADQAAAAARLRLWRLAATGQPEPQLEVYRCGKCRRHHVRTITD